MPIVVGAGSAGCARLFSWRANTRAVALSRAKVAARIQSHRRIQSALVSHAKERHARSHPPNVPLVSILETALGDTRPCITLSFESIEKQEGEQEKRQAFSAPSPSWRFITLS